MVDYQFDTLQQRTPLRAGELIKPFNDISWHYKIPDLDYVLELGRKLP